MEFYYIFDLGLGKVPQRLQNALFASSSILAENINDKIVIRSSECEYAVEKVRNSILNLKSALNTPGQLMLISFQTSSVITSCPKCSRILHTEDEEDDVALIDDFSDVESIMSVEEDFSEKLEILQQRGIVVNPTEPKRKAPKQVETSQPEENLERQEDANVIRIHLKFNN